MSSMIETPVASESPSADQFVRSTAIGSPAVFGAASVDAAAAQFPDRRRGEADAPGVERRQFAASRSSENPEANALAEAIDQYKLENRRRFVTIDELLGVIKSLGYRQDDAAND